MNGMHLMIHGAHCSPKKKSDMTMFKTDPHGTLPTVLYVGGEAEVMIGASCVISEVGNTAASGAVVYCHIMNFLHSALDVIQQCFIFSLTKSALHNVWHPLQRDFKCYIVHIL